MFSIISTMFLGIGIGYVLRNWSILQKTEKTISLTIFLLLFILGVSICVRCIGKPDCCPFGTTIIFQERRRTMKGSLIVIVFFCVGCIMGAFNKFEFDTHTVSMYILYALMLQVGISIGSNKNLKAIVSHLHPKMLLIPLGTIIGTLLFSALASLLLRQWSVFDCMAVGSGFAYYSLSSILITQFKEPSIGLQLATELGTIALLTNIFREMMALLGTPIIKKYFGKLAPISAAGVNSMDVLLPSITRYSGKEMIPIAILHGILIDISVPVFVSFFCNL